MLAVLDGNPGTIILDRDVDRSIGFDSHGTRRDSNHTLLASIPDRIAHQVRDHLFYPTFVERQPKNPRRQVELDLDPSLIEQGRQRFQPRTNQSVKVRFGNLDRKGRTRRRLGLKQIDDELIEAPTSLETLVDIVSLLVVERSVGFVLQQTTEAGDHGDRRS
jgi:hypothetical protein